MVDIRQLGKSFDANELEKICLYAATEIGYRAIAITDKHGSRRVKLTRPLFGNHFSVPIMYIQFHGNSTTLFMNYGLHFSLFDIGFYGFGRKNTADEYFKVICEEVHS